MRINNDIIIEMILKYVIKNNNIQIINTIIDPMTYVIIQDRRTQDSFENEKRWSVDRS